MVGLSTWCVEAGRAERVRGTHGAGAVVRVSTGGGGWLWAGSGTNRQGGCGFWGPPSLPPPPELVQEARGEGEGFPGLSVLGPP